MADRSTLWEVSELVLEAGLDPDRWLEVPEGLATIWPGTKVVLHAHEKATLHSVGMVTHGFDPQVSADYRDHYAFANPWIPLIQAAPVGAGLCADEVLPSSAFTHLEFHEWIRREGEVDSAAGIKLLDDEDRFAVINLHYGSRIAARYNEELPGSLQRLYASLRTALALNRELGQQTLANASIDTLLEALDLPALQLDRQGKLRNANAAGRAELRHGRVLRQDRAGIVRPIHARRSGAFAAAVRGACLAPRDGASPTELVLPVRNAAQPVLASLLPMASPLAHSRASWLFETERLVLLQLRGLAPGHRLDPRLLQRLFGFTDTEARLAARLATGQTLAEAGAALQISRHTTRQHLKQVFGKTGMHRQVDLALLLARFAGRSTARDD